VLSVCCVVMHRFRGWCIAVIPAHDFVRQNLNAAARDTKLSVQLATITSDIPSILTEENDWTGTGVVRTRFGGVQAYPLSFRLCLRNDRVRGRGQVIDAGHSLASWIDSSVYSAQSKRLAFSVATVQHNITLHFRAQWLVTEELVLGRAVRAVVCGLPQDLAAIICDYLFDARIFGSYSYRRSQIPMFEYAADGTFTLTCIPSRLLSPFVPDVRCDISPSSLEHEAHGATQTDSASRAPAQLALVYPSITSADRLDLVL